MDRLPPHSPAAEMALLGAMIADPRSVADVLPLVNRAEDFFSDAHGLIFESILELYEKHQHADLVQLVEAVSRRTPLENIGGGEFLVKLAEDTPSAANAKYYAQIVAAKARLRQLISIAGTIAYEAYHGGEYDPDDVRKLLDWAESEIFKIAERGEKTDPQRLAELLMVEIERLERADGSRLLGVATGYPDLDDMLSGLKAGEMLILAGRPSMGKTALGLNIAEQIAFGGKTPWQAPRGEEPVPVGVFSLEMSKEAVTQRLVSSFTGADSHRLRTGGYGKSELTRIIQDAIRLGSAPIIIDDTPGLSVLGLRARARRMRAQHKIQCVIIDYLQLLSAPNLSRESRQVEVSAISRGVKELARELEVPVICLAQLNRGSEQREGHRPRMSDLRESGSIEQDADVVMLIHREAYYHKGDPNWEGDENLSELIIAKQRNGPTGIVKLTWDGPSTRFKSYAGPGRDDGPFDVGPQQTQASPQAGPQPGARRSVFKPAAELESRLSVEGVAGRPPTIEQNAAAIPRERDDDDPADDPELPPF